MLSKQNIYFFQVKNLSNRMTVSFDSLISHSSSVLILHISLCDKVYAWKVRGSGIESVQYLLFVETGNFALEKIIVGPSFCLFFCLNTKFSFVISAGLSAVL